jgi:multidrug resistance efflux pump
LWHRDWRVAEVPDIQYILNNTIAITSSLDGFVKELKVAVGFKVKKGSLILTLEAADDADDADDADAYVLEPKQALAGVSISLVAT